MRRAAGLAWARNCVLACVLCVGGCGDDDGGGAAETITQLVGPSGGTVELASGGKVTIPAGALSETVAIKITKLELGDVQAVPNNLEAADKPYAFEPHGTNFAQAVKIEVPYEGDETDVRPIKLDDEDDTTWQTLVGSEKDDAAKKLSIDVTSFSVILAARPRRGSGVITLPDGAIVEGGSGGTGGASGSAGSSGSGGTSGSGGSGGSSGAPADAWAALYPYDGAQWNDYVSNNGSDVTSAIETPCNPMTDGPGYDGCIHGGEIRVIRIEGQSSCAGLTVTDSLDAFDWTCLVIGDLARAVSTGLKAGKHLSDLIDPTTAAWRPNSIIVRNAGGTEVHRSFSEAWWSNPIVVDNDGIAVGETTPGTIYIVTQDVTADYAISSSKTGFVVMPGASITPAAAQYAALYLGDPNASGEIDFNWIEGTVNSTTLPGVSGNEHRFSMLRHLTVTAPNMPGLSVYCAKSKIVDFQSYDTEVGIALNAAECAIDGARIENTVSGIRTGRVYTDSATGPNTIENVVIEGGSTFVNGQVGISIHAETPAQTLRNITIHNQPGVGIRVDSSNNTLSGITIEDTSSYMQDGLFLSGLNNSVSDITISGGQSRGIVVGYEGHSIRNASLSRMVSWAIDLQFSHNNTLASVNISRSGGGIRLYNAYRNRIWDVMLGNVGEPIYGSGTALQTTFEGGTGSENQRSDNVVSNIYIVNSGLLGFEVNGSQSNLYQYMTVANTGHENMLNTTPSPVSYGGRGIRFTSSFSKGNSFNNLLLVNNADSGLDVNPHITGTAIDWVEDTRFHNIAALHNGKRSYGSVFGKDIGTGIRLGEFAVDVTFSGALLLANNGIDPEQNCHVFSDSTPKTEAGLTDSTLNYTCAPVGGSTATLDVLANGYGALGPMTTGDSSNLADTNGFAMFSAIANEDWTRFASPERAWGPDASSFPAAENWGVCRSTGSCRIYDWSLSSADTDVRAILPIPTGNDVLTHTFWAVDQATCDTVPATWNGNACVSTFLTNAREIMDDGLGNENTLCESGETCLYTPNFGAYQGHGALISAGTFTPGTVTGVTLLQHTENGR